jgi:hypothetical protein
VIAGLLGLAVSAGLMQQGLITVPERLNCGSWDLTNRTVSDGVTSEVAGVPVSR